MIDLWTQTSLLGGSAVHVCCLSGEQAKKIIWECLGERCCRTWRTGCSWGLWTMIVSAAPQMLPVKSHQLHSLGVTEPAEWRVPVPSEQSHEERERWMQGHPNSPYFVYGCETTWVNITDRQMRQIRSNINQIRVGFSRFSYIFKRIIFHNVKTIGIFPLSQLSTSPFFTYLLAPLMYSLRQQSTPAVLGGVSWEWLVKVLGYGCPNSLLSIHSRCHILMLKVSALSQLPFAEGKCEFLKLQKLFKPKKAYLEDLGHGIHPIQHWKNTYDMRFLLLSWKARI